MADAMRTGEYRSGHLRAWLFSGSSDQSVMMVAAVNCACVLGAAWRVMFSQDGPPPLGVALWALNWLVFYLACVELSRRFQV